MAAKSKNNDILMYKEKPLVRRGNLIYYGNPKDKYILCLEITDSTPLDDITISKNIMVTLQHNNDNMSPKQKIIKKAERNGLYSALDIGVFWLEDALEQGK